MKVHSVILCSVLLFFALLGEPIYSQVIPSELRTKVENSDIIVTGKVIEQASQWNNDKTRIYTFVRIRVDELLKGSEYKNEITIKHPGGEIGSIGEVYSHIPSFSDNEEVLVFLKKSASDGSLRVYGGDEGKFSFYDDPNTNDKLTSNKVKVSELKREIRSFIKQ
ncbi:MULTISPECIES: hypothetical protein [Ignavibacterium]|jgi:hypothetical protein|uniref:hypothetical protein n=1 Tax=Ignavibacterium TaxID=795750 RepID=UPI0025BF5547|nr:MULTISPECIES: hypothetical protein [Ignavibacterium]MBI5662626.1 hypothetical protein [Ignavibacterium album]